MSQGGFRPAKRGEGRQARDGGDREQARVFEMGIGEVHGSGRAGPEDGPADLGEEEEGGEADPDEAVAFVDDGFAEAHLGAFEPVDRLVDAAQLGLVERAVDAAVGELGHIVEHDVVLRGLGHPRGLGAEGVVVEMGCGT